MAVQQKTLIYGSITSHPPLINPQGNVYRQKRRQKDRYFPSCGLRVSSLTCLLHSRRNSRMPSQQSKQTVKQLPSSAVYRSVPGRSQVQELCHGPLIPPRQLLLTPSWFGFTTSNGAQRVGEYVLKRSFHLSAR